MTPLEDEARPDPHHLPPQRRGTTPQMVGRYPEYDVLSEADHWDEVTRRVVLDRVANVPAIRFFDHREERTLAAFCDVVTAQEAELLIPVLNYIDEKLFEGKRDGWQYHDLPEDGEVWRRVGGGSTTRRAHRASTRSRTHRSRRRSASCTASRRDGCTAASGGR